MEHDMKVSSSVIRRLRTERGWSQDQLAIASGLSLRTIQRVEAKGIASMASAVSLAATFEVCLIELQNEPAVPASTTSAFAYHPLFLGIAIITVAVIIEAARPLTMAQSSLFLTLMVLMTLVGVLMILPAFVDLVRKRRYIALALAAMGMPLVTLLAIGLIYAIASDRVPSWHLSVIGAAGAALVVMAVRELQCATRSVSARR
ncbi:helix-turn-helix transcriptional regulator [Oleiagrimonas soli]|uniref:Transcriptional regulator with XRE-family HTH domain n=1 Tax=Oleiagrimonas soli TaxID=1543381 RepID=A0A841KFE0_9GAMM|nr:helix-turn-helix transcriptional regulator [Oleiagrimonas soli]MBB6183912.1 transcriptional regulator with XRE-family HTH domain [Oleiagrimonas soli]